MTKNNEETVDAVASSLHRHHEARAIGSWPNMWTKYDDLNSVSRDEYRDRAAELIEAVQGTDTLDEAANALAMVWCRHGPALAKYVAYAHERITETLSDVPHLKETK